MVSYRPEVVDEDVEAAKDDDQHNGAEFGLEANHDHDTGHETKNGHNDTPDIPLAAKDEADEEKDEQHATSELEVHLAILLVNLGQTGKGF